MSQQVELYDTTLRDGVQREGLTFSLEDKLKVARKLDALGIRYIEGGYPGSNPRDQEFFARARQMTWQNATIVAFGATRYKGNRAENDPNLRALLETGTPAATLVCKNSAFHVREVLGVPLEENLSMIRESVAFLKQHGKQVFHDAEHFFDGWKEDREYAIACLRAASEAGADGLVLCDTNGGTLTHEVGEIVRAVRDAFPDATIGIHTHNDAELAVANTLAAVRAGATHVQGTINGYGERCGNANLCAIIPNLKLKLGVDCVADEQLRSLSQVSHFVSELANLHPDPHMAYVGASAFAHKAGYHADAMRKNPLTYQHVDPAAVGNQPKILISELSGKGAVATKAQALGLHLDSPEQVREVVERVKLLESKGYQFEGADASFELMVRRIAPDYVPLFELVDFFVMVETREGRKMLSEAMVKVRVDGQTLHTAGEGNGPVNALDQAMRKALVASYAAVAIIRLTDYKVRVIDEGSGTAASVRVLIDSSDGSATWTTVGSSTNIIEASWLALADSFEYGLLRAVNEHLHRRAKCDAPEPAPAQESTAAIAV
ncbi:MAG: citramalate synthase [Chloroflexi bacterium]|nr:citramalate synthase [Chloroflexota bacterium]